MSQNRLGFATISRGAETQPRAAALHGDAPRLRSTFILACGLPVLRHTSSDFAQHWPSPSHLNLRSSFAVGDLSNSKNLLVAPHAVDRDEDAWKLYVFRKSRDLLSTRSLLQQLRAEIDCLHAGSASAIDALLLAGQIETGLADAGATAAIDAAHVGHHLAGIVCGDTLDQSPLLRSLQRVEAAKFATSVRGAA